MTRAPRVSAIIVNWNGAHHLRICLPSLLSQTFQSLEIVVVDNGSSDDSKKVAEEFQVRWLALDKNAGLAPALNRGAQIAAGELLLFVNNDMRFDSQFVSSLVQPLDADATVFATDGMQFNWDGTSREHLAARLCRTKPIRSSVELVPGLYFYQEETASNTAVFMGSAACMLVRRTFFESLHGFDDRLPLGYEDVEICWRAWLHGWKTAYIPKAICWHRVGGSARSAEGLRLNFCGILRGRLLLATKLLPWRYVIRTWLISAAALAKDVSLARWRLAKERVAVLIQMVKLIPQLLRERKALFGGAGNSPQDHLDFLLGLGL